MLNYLSCDVLDYLCGFLGPCDLLRMRLVSHRVWSGVRRAAICRCVLRPKKIDDLKKIREELEGHFEVRTLHYGINMGSPKNCTESYIVPWITTIRLISGFYEEIEWMITPSVTTLEFSWTLRPIHIPSHIKHLIMGSPPFKDILSFPEQLETLECEFSFLQENYDMLSCMLPPSTTKVIVHVGHSWDGSHIKKVANAIVEECMRPCLTEEAPTLESIYGPLMSRMRHDTIVILPARRPYYHTDNAYRYTKFDDDDDNGGGPPPLIDPDNIRE